MLSCSSQLRIAVLLFWLVCFLPSASCHCPNHCSGHGTCGESSVCTCDKDWNWAADCSTMKCPTVSNTTASYMIYRSLCCIAFNKPGPNHQCRQTHGLVEQYQLIQHTHPLRYIMFSWKYPILQYLHLILYCSLSLVE